jgi:glycosyltransferase involved in cell wall biosynthesis
VPEGDAGALAERLAAVLADPRLRERLGREATRWAAEHRWPCVAESVCRLYSELRPAAREHLPHAPCRSWL